ncbi:hypothetical protein Q7P37_001666 [Cladosporium fusiforme]
MSQTLPLAQTGLPAGLRWICGSCLDSMPVTMLMQSGGQPASYMSRSPCTVDRPLKVMPAVTLVLLYSHPPSTCLSACEPVCLTALAGCVMMLGVSLVRRWPVGQCCTELRSENKAIHAALESTADSNPRNRTECRPVGSLLHARIMFPFIIARRSIFVLSRSFLLVRAALLSLAVRAGSPNMFSSLAWQAAPAVQGPREACSSEPAEAPKVRGSIRRGQETPWPSSSACRSSPSRARPSCARHLDRDDSQTAVGAPGQAPCRARAPVLVTSHLSLPSSAIASDVVMP